MARTIWRKSNSASPVGVLLHRESVHWRSLLLCNYTCEETFVAIPRVPPTDAQVNRGGFVPQSSETLDFEKRARALRDEIVYQRLRLASHTQLLEERLRNEVDERLSHVRNVIDSVRHAVSVDYQVKHHPWKTVVGAIFFGLVLSRAWPGSHRTVTTAGGEQGNGKLPASVYGRFGNTPPVTRDPITVSGVAAGAFRHLMRDFLSRAIAGR